MKSIECDIAVIGGGLVGMAVAYGLQNLGNRVTVFDEGDQAYRASRGNFGLVWVQGKGVNLPDYARWSRLSASLWPAFANELQQSSPVGLELAQPGGMRLFLDDDEAQQTTDKLKGLRTALGGDYPYEYLGHNALRDLIPEIGPQVVGATYCPEDGHVNPLYLLRALTLGFNQHGGQLNNGSRVESIEPLASGFVLRRAEHAPITVERVVLCAGLGNANLAPMVGLSAPVRPQRGQVLITERAKPFLRYPTMQVRQVGEGAVQIGDSQEEVGLDDRTSSSVVGTIADRAVRMFPVLSQLRLVRSWGALRVMSNDGHPVYDQSVQFPGASLVTCHSGVTLAAAHAQVIARWINGSPDYPDYLESFSAKRFNV